MAKLDAKALSIKYLLKKRYTVADAERHVRRMAEGRKWVHKTFDMFGFADIMAYNGTRTLAVQVTVVGEWLPHRLKMENDDNVDRWCSLVGREAELHIWYKADHQLKHRHDMRRFRWVRSERRWDEIEVSL